MFITQFLQIYSCIYLVSVLSAFRSGNVRSAEANANAINSVKLEHKINNLNSETSPFVRLILVLGTHEDLKFS